jgi:NAD(P)-dependent dehydrogenase (short-subunit alcohol dehydrogenase family)
MSNRLEGKVAVITGGSSGIGLATAERFVAEGAHVFVTGRRLSLLDAAVKRIGRNVTAVHGDVAKLADLDSLHDAVRAEKGRVDILVANAGGGGGLSPLGQITEDQYERVFGTNVKGLLFTVLKLLPLMPEGASIILTSSVASTMGTPAVSVYGASKAAVRSFARTWTTDLKDRKIRVNAICPGPIETTAMDKSGGGDEGQKFKNSLVALVPMGRIGQPDEIATAAVFLASEDSSFVTGIELPVDGGMAQI